MQTAIPKRDPTLADANTSTAQIQRALIERTLEVSRKAMMVAKIAKIKGTIAADTAPKHADRSKECEFWAVEMGASRDVAWYGFVLLISMDSPLRFPYSSHTA
jgi:hypothetical protein